MVGYNQEPVRMLSTKGQASQIPSFINLGDSDENIDWETVKSFGEEWSKFDSFSEEEIQKIGKDYFDIVDQAYLSQSRTVALDVGCGTGRWTKFLAPKVNFVEAIDPSDSVFTAAHFLKDHENVRVTQASIENLPFPPESFDFVFSLGVLHHIPNTRQALAHCVSQLKPGGLLLIYLYYDLENRGISFRLLLKVVTLIRKFVSLLPAQIKKIVCDVIALTVYVPLAAIAWSLKSLRFKGWNSVPLSYYHDKTLNVMRNDALDRFGTPLEQRFSRKDIEEMLVQAGMIKVLFSDHEPFWHVISTKA